MKINKEIVNALNPCKGGYDWYLNNYSEDLLETLLNVNQTNSFYARWLFTNLMNNEQNVKIAIYSAKLVIDIYEAKHPNDSRPRKAIQAASNWLENKSDVSVATARAAASAASDAASAAYAASDASTAYAAYDAAITEIQEKIIHEAVRTLDNE